MILCRLSGVINTLKPKVYSITKIYFLCRRESVSLKKRNSLILCGKIHYLLFLWVSYLKTTCNKVLIEKLLTPKLVKNFSAFIAVLTKAFHLPLTSVRWSPILLLQDEVWYYSSIYVQNFQTVSLLHASTPNPVNTPCKTHIIVEY